MLLCFRCVLLRSFHNKSVHVHEGSSRNDSDSAIGSTYRRRKCRDCHSVKLLFPNSIQDVVQIGRNLKATELEQLSVFMSCKL